MPGLMMDYPLTTTSILRHAEQVFPEVEIVSVTHDNPRHRYTFREAFSRSRQLANALQTLNLQAGERIATLAWNDYRHFEIYYASTCSGLVCHTINPRLFEEQIRYIFDHAEDQWLFCDPQFVPLIEQLWPKLKTLKGVVVMTDAAHMPSSSLESLICYETLLAKQSTNFDFPELDEQSASSLCYTSGTTGHPKGVLYSHRSTVLHAIASVAPNAFDISCQQVVMPLVPMFHVNAWGLPYSAAMSGAKIVFPGNKMADGEILADLIISEEVTFSAGVPTVLQALHSHLQNQQLTVPSLQRCIVGGATCPVSLIDSYQENYGVTLQPAWGMTELSPVGTVNIPKRNTSNHDSVSQGLPIYGVEFRIENDNGEPLPWDGQNPGKLKVRGPWVASGYFQQPDINAIDEQGWFDTGDIALFDSQAYMRITDRAKDLIKSGGEWISSIELENIATDHPAIAEATVIGAHHEKWDERPLLIAIKKTDCDINEQQLLDHYQGKIAKWCRPDAIVFVNELPHTATGKLDKKVVREQYQYFFSEVTE